MFASGADPARRRALAGLAVLALLLHGALLGGLDPGASRPGAAIAPVLQVRQIEQTVTPAAAVAVAEPVTAPPPPPRSTRPRVPAPVPKKVAPADEAAPVAVAAAEPASLPASSAEPMPESVPASVPEAASAAASVPEAPAGGTPPPLYRTTVPPPVTLRYELQRGRITGSGELQWRPQADRYELRLEGSVVGLRVLTQLSQGTLDTHGLAPERFTDQRARRPMQAANFRRDVGRISFSGPPQELPLWPGVQDRLSWMLQLAAIVAAEPARWVAGERIVLQVVGARGDAGPWSFEVLGAEPFETPAGTVPALHLRREPRGPFDTTVEVWLDPAQHHLPVHATLRSGEDDRLELRLRELIPGP